MAAAPNRNQHQMHLTKNYGGRRSRQGSQRPKAPRDPKQALSCRSTLKSVERMRSCCSLSEKEHK